MSTNMSSFVCTNLHVIRANSNTNQSFLGCSRLRFHYNLTSSTQGRRNHRTLSVSCGVQPLPPPIPSSPTPPAGGFFGKGWIAGAVLAFLLPFLTNKWGPLLLLKKDVDQKLQAIEDVAEGLEKLADKVEHMAEDVGKKLPEGSLKRAANLIEDAAEKVELAAHLTDSAIDRIQELEDKLESYEESNPTKTNKLVQEKSKNEPTTS